MHRSQSLGFAVKNLSNHIKRTMINFADRTEADITGMQGWIIEYLVEKETEDVFQKDIEKEFNIRGPTATQILRLMEKKELIVRRPDDDDARQKKITLTAKALSLLDTLDTEARRVEEQMRKGLSDGEVILFLKTIDTMNRNFENGCL